MHSEAFALSEGLAECEWWATMLSLATNARVEMRDRDALKRGVRVTSLFRSPMDERVFTIAVSDAKSLYDNLVRESTKGERRAALELVICRESLCALHGTQRWLPHEKNPTDCLTKLCGNSEQLISLLKNGFFKLSAENQVMQERSDYRTHTGKRNPRPTVTAGSQKSLQQRTRTSIQEDT